MHKDTEAILRETYRLSTGLHDVNQSVARLGIAVTKDMLALAKRVKTLEDKLSQ